MSRHPSLCEHYELTAVKRWEGGGGITYACDECGKTIDIAEAFL